MPPIPRASREIAERDRRRRGDTGSEIDPRGPGGHLYGRVLDELGFIPGFERGPGMTQQEAALMLGSGGVLPSLRESTRLHAKIEPFGQSGRGAGVPGKMSKEDRTAFNAIRGLGLDKAEARAVVGVINRLKGGR